MRDRSKKAGMRRAKEAVVGAGAVGVEASEAAAALEQGEASGAASGEASGAGSAVGVLTGRMGLAKVVKEERAVLLGAIGAASGGAVREGPGGVVSVEARAGGVVKAGAGEATVERPRERAPLKAPPAPAITFPTNYWTSSSEGFSAASTATATSTNLWPSLWSPPSTAGAIFTCVFNI